MKVKIVDRTHFVSETSHNGGDYSFTATYHQIADDKFEVSYSTSADFDYCPLCGSFYQGNCPCGMEGPEIVSWEEVETAVDIANIRRDGSFEDIRVYWED